MFNPNPLDVSPKYMQPKHLYKERSRNRSILCAAPAWDLMRFANHFISPKLFRKSIWHDVATIELLFLWREAEKKNKDIYEDLPLFVIEQTYGSTEAGKKLVCIPNLMKQGTHQSFVTIFIQKKVTFDPSRMLEIEIFTQHSVLNHFRHSSKCWRTPSVITGW